MKFIVSSTQLLKQLQILGGVINTNNTLPILDNFLFELNQSQLKISASDLETTMSAVITIIILKVRGFLLRVIIFILVKEYRGGRIVTAMLSIVDS